MTTVVLAASLIMVSIDVALLINVRGTGERMKLYQIKILLCSETSLLKLPDGALRGMRIPTGSEDGWRPACHIRCQAALRWMG